MDHQDAIYQRIGQQYLESFGYLLIAKDVSYNGLAFEVWYINPSLVQVENFAALEPNTNLENHFN